MVTRSYLAWHLAIHESTAFCYRVSFGRNVRNKHCSRLIVLADLAANIWVFSSVYKPSNSSSPTPAEHELWYHTSSWTET
jgi:hypothetical protein